MVVTPYLLYIRFIIWGILYFSWSVLFSFLLFLFIFLSLGWDPYLIIFCDYFIVFCVCTYVVSIFYSFSSSLAPFFTFFFSYERRFCFFFPFIHSCLYDSTIIRRRRCRRRRRLCVSSTTSPDCVSIAIFLYTHPTPPSLYPIQSDYYYPSNNTAIPPPLRLPIRRIP